MSDVIAKIQKLMALAERAGTEEEAAAAFEKAQRLMAKHAIEDAALTPEQQEQITESFVKLGRDEIRRSKVRLLSALGKANRCQVLDSRTHVIIIGFKSDVEFVEMLYASVLIQYAGERTRAWKAYQRETPEFIRDSRFIWVNAFSWAYMARVGERLEQAARRHTNEEGTKALVLVDRAERVADWTRDKYHPKTRTVRVRGNHHANAAGRDAADRADLSGGRGHVRQGSRRAIG